MATTQPLHLLHLEDAQPDFDLCLRALKMGGMNVEADRVRNEEEFREQLKKSTYDIVLADYAIPGWTGLAAFQLIRSMHLDLPFVIVTGSLGDELAAECMRQGVSDYIVKDRLTRLPNAVRQAIQRKQTADALRHTEVERESLLRRLQASNADLGNTLRERELLLQEIHHRVKNNLQVVSSLINLQLQGIENQPAREALQKCQARVQAIALTHEMLYQSKDYSNISFTEYARNLATSIFHTAGVTTNAISMELAMDDVSLGVDKAIPCGLILNELIINALKHAFPSGRHGTLRIELHRTQPDRLLLAVKDNGVGLPPGADFESSHSLGMHLVNALADQLGTELEIIRGDGTTFQFSFAVHEEARNVLPFAGVQGSKHDGL